MARKGISVRFEVSSLPERLPAEVETSLFRAAQEALTNIERHASAERVLVQCGMQDDAFVLEIEDDGEGFEPASAVPTPANARGLGLLGMRERVELLGGHRHIGLRPRRGTRVVIRVPRPWDNSETMTKIRVLIADDHAILREGLRALLALADDLDVVGEAADGQQAIDKVGVCGRTSC